MQQPKTLSTIDEHRSKIDRNSVFDCHLSPVGNKWQLKTLFLTIFDLFSSIVLVFSIATYPVCVRPELFIYLVLLRFLTDLRVERGNKNENNSLHAG